MAGFFRKTMDYLGLSDDDGYGDYDPYEEQGNPNRRPQTASAPDSDPVLVHPRSTVHAVPSAPEQGTGVIGVTVQGRPGTNSGTVRTVTPTRSTKVHVVAPTGFGDAQDIGERLRSAQPVVINLQGVERDLAKRLVDFASGLAFGLNGDMKKVAEKVFMLTPSNTEVSADEKRRLVERGLYTA